MKREHFFVRVFFFTNKTVSQTTVSTGPMKMVRFEHETMNVCQRNLARFVHVERRFDKIRDIFCDFRKMEALKVNKLGRTNRVTFRVMKLGRCILQCVSQNF